MDKPLALYLEVQNLITSSVRVYAVIISKYAARIVGTQKREVACVHGPQDQKQWTTYTKMSGGGGGGGGVKTCQYWSCVLCNTSKSQRDCYIVFSCGFPRSVVHSNG